METSYRRLAENDFVELKKLGYNFLYFDELDVSEDWIADSVDLSNFVDESDCLPTNLLIAVPSARARPNLDKLGWLRVSLDADNVTSTVIDQQGSPRVVYIASKNFDLYE